MVNGPAWKALIEEEFGDGINVGDRFRRADRAAAEPEGRPGQDHHVGQFLPYKYYGNSGNVPEYGYKEE